MLHKAQKTSKDNANLGQAKLIAVLGQKELGNRQLLQKLLGKIMEFMNKLLGVQKEL